MPSSIGRSDLRVLMTADAVGGVWSYALDLAGGLRRRGVETTLAVLGPTPSDNQVQAALAAGIHALLPTGLPLDWTAATPQELAAAGRGVADLAAQVGADLVHLNSPALAAGMPFRVPVLAVCHSCLASWWAAMRGGPMPPDFVWRVDKVRRGYQAAQALAAPTAAFAGVTARLYGLESPPTMVRNGRKLPPSVEPRAGLPRDFVFTAGRLWDEGKNAITLDRAARLLGIPVLAAGPLKGPNGARIGLDHVHTLGPLGHEDIAGFLAASPIFASLARYEPFGLAVLEAAQARCPLVLADIPTFRELWDGAALFVPAEDDVGAAAAIECIAANPDRRAELADAASRRAQAYTVDVMAEGALGLYRSMLPEGARPVFEDAAA